MRIANVAPGVGKNFAPALRYPVLIEKCLTLFASVIFLTCRAREERQLRPACIFRYLSSSPAENPGQARILACSVFVKQAITEDRARSQRALPGFHHFSGRRHAT